MPVHKITVSLSEDAYEHAVRSAQGEGISLSAWLSKAADHMAHIRDGLLAVAEFEAEHGAFTEDEMDITDARLDELGIGRPVTPEERKRAEEALRGLRSDEVGDDEVNRGAA